MESMPAGIPPVTVGVDSHQDQHVAAVVDQTGRLCGTQAFAASTRGYVALVTWAEGFGPVERIGIEGTGTYGAGLARFARAYGLQVVEVDRPDRSTRRRRGKSDPIDAHTAARATLAGVAATIPKTREGHVEMIRVLRVARRGALKARVAAAEQLHGVRYSAPKSSANTARPQDQDPGRRLRSHAARAAHQHLRRDQGQPAEPGSALATTPGRT
jgi:transposase